MYFYFNLLTYLNRLFAVDEKIAVTSLLFVLVVVFSVLKINLFNGDDN